MSAMSESPQDSARRKAKRQALVLGAFAVAVYVAYLLWGALS